MLLPMIAFTFMLMVAGFLACIIVTGMTKPDQLAARVSFGLLFSGLGAFGLSMALAALGGALFGEYGIASWLSFLGGYGLGGLAGAVIGWKKASHFT
ncbi:MAG: hypothetical protein ABI977_01150 [Acidobacteriota bacterium]